MQTIIRGICSLTLIFFSVAVLAQEAPLTDKAVTSYIQSLKEMEGLSEKINQEDTDDATAMAELWLKGDSQEIAQHLQSKDYYPELRSAIEKAGFSDVTDWVNIAQRVTNAFMALELDEQGGDVAAQMEAGLEQIRNSTQLTDDQKEALIAQLKNSQKQLARIEEVSQADRQAVQPHMEALRQQFQAEE